MKRSLIIATSLLLSLVACTKIENLSVDTSLKSFKVNSHSPQSIVLGDVKISADTVYLPIEYGKYQFPLTLNVEATATSGAYIYGVGGDEPIIFNSIDDQPVRFVVSAASGVSKNYYFALFEVPLDESCEFYETVAFCGEQEEGLLLSGELLENGAEQSCKMLVAVGASYPLTLTPQFCVAQSTSIESYCLVGEEQWSHYDNGDSSLTFESEEQYYQFELISQSGKSEVCKVGLWVVDFVEIDATMQVNYRDLCATSNQSGVAVRSYDVDFEIGDITLFVEAEGEASVEFPLELSVDIPANEWLSHVGVSDSQTYSFTDWDDQFSFALLDSEKLKATSWSVRIATAQDQEEEWVVSTAEISDFSCGTVSSYIFTYNHLTRSESITQAQVYNHTREILLYYSSYYEPILSSSTVDNWWAEYELTLALSNGESTTQRVRWEAEANSSNKITKTEIRAALSSVQYFDVEQADGSTVQWAVSLVKDSVEASSECDFLGLSIVGTTPSYVTFDDPAYVIDQLSGEIYINIGERFNFPMSLDVEYEISPYASIAPSHLYFEDELSEQAVTIVAQDGVTSSEFVVKLIVPQESVAPDVVNIEFGALASGAALMGEAMIDVENKLITIGVEATDAHFPLVLPIVGVEVADGGSFDMPTSESLTFSSAQSRAMAWVSSADGVTRQMWNFEIYYYQQLSGGDMDSWEWDASPVTSALPWSTPNMSGIAAVTNTTPIAGRSGVAGDYAAQMQTGTSWGQLASGSIFTGWFDKNNSTIYGLSDPVRLTYFGTPFTPDAKIIGISAEVSYAQGASGEDWGSLTAILINEDPTATFEFHGNKPNDSDDPTAGSAPHPNNTALEVASTKMIFGNGSKTQTSYGDPIIMNVEAGEWVEVFIPLSSDEPFTHISVAAASSAYGDYFIGEVGSVMRLDNVKIIYE